MRVSIVSIALAAMFLTALPLAAVADPTPPPSMAVTGSGSVHYAPDIAHLSLGVRAQSASAAAAAKSVNERAQAVIEAVRKLGIADADIATSNYTIEYQPPQQGDAGDPPPVTVQPMPTARKPLPQGGSYVATEEIDVQTSVAKAGSVLDASVGAGSNQTYGISFDTSQRSALYKEALARAVADARSQAEVLAKAAGVSIAGVQSISAGGASVMPAMRGVAAMALATNAPVMAGTGTVDASVEIVFRLR